MTTNNEPEQQLAGARLLTIVGLTGIGVIHLLDSHPEIRWMVDVHSYVPAVYHVWGSDEPQTAEIGYSLAPAHQRKIRYHDRARAD